MSKKFKIIGAAVFVLGITAAGAGLVHAATTAPGAHNPMSAMVAAIAAKFNLNSADVQAVVDQTQATQRAQMEATQQQRFKDRLASAVTAGTLTQAQADAITAKQAEVKTFMDSLKGKSLVDRAAAMKTEMASLKQWATDNNIPQQFQMFFGRGPGGRGHGPGGPGFGWGKPAPAAN